MPVGLTSQIDPKEPFLVAPSDRRVGSGAIINHRQNCARRVLSMLHSFAGLLFLASPSFSACGMGISHVLDGDVAVKSPMRLRGGNVKIPRFIAMISLALMALWGPGARATDATIEIGYIDPFSGAFAAGGDASLKMFQFIIDNINAKGGALGKKFELVTFDDKLQPAEALIALKSVTDQNLPFVMSCVGSNVGAALIDAVNKHNARNPDNRVLFLKLWSACHRANQRAVQLLALPLPRQR